MFGFLATDARRVLHVIGAFVSALVAIFGFAMPLAGAVAPKSTSAAYAYAVHVSDRLVNAPASERGPPAAHDHDKEYNAVDLRSHGTSASPKAARPWGS